MIPGSAKLLMNGLSHPDPLNYDTDVIPTSCAAFTFLIGLLELFWCVQLLKNEYIIYYKAFIFFGMCMCVFQCVLTLWALVQVCG